MKIAIFGSYRSSSPMGDDIGDSHALENFCFRLGSVLAGFRHTFIVETDAPHTADRLVVNGILASGQAHPIDIRVYYQPAKRPDRPFAKEVEANDGVFRFNPLPGARVSASYMHILRDADLAIVAGGGANSYAAGLAASLMGVRLIPVAAFGGAGRLLWQQLSDQFDSRIAKLPLRHTWDNIAGTPESAIKAIQKEIASLPRLMIVHGRSSDRMVVDQILRNQGIINPIVLQERLTAGKTIPEKFEREARQADGAVVLFTPDDQAASTLSATGESVSAGELRVRARQNVILEYGWFWGKLGRDRVLLILKGELELPTDLAGIFYQSYSISPDECRHAIIDFIERI
jgi:predicted nucleotide-binding protein